MLYIEDRIFKLSDLVKLYTQCLEQLGADISNRVKPTRLKEKTLLAMPNLEASKRNYKVILTFEKDTGDALLLAHQQDSDSDAIVLTRAAQIVRAQIFRIKYEFQGSLDDDHYDMTTRSLVALMQ